MQRKGKGAASVLIVLVVAAATSCGLLDALLGTDLEGDGSPTEVTGLSVAGTVSYDTAARDVVGDGSYAYVATYTYSGDYGGVSVVDVSTPASPTKRGAYYPTSSSTSLYASYIAKSGDSVYIDGGSVRYFAKVSVSTPSSPTGSSSTTDRTASVPALLPTARPCTTTATTEAASISSTSQAPTLPARGLDTTRPLAILRVQVAPIAGICIYESAIRRSARSS